MDILGGRVIMAQVNHDTTGDQHLVRCIEIRARTWTFPDDTDEKIVLPFVLQQLTRARTCSICFGSDPFVLMCPCRVFQEGEILLNKTQ